MTKKKKASLKPKVFAYRVSGKKPGGKYPEGTRYHDAHKGTCKWWRDVFGTGVNYYGTISKARSLGLTPCKRCTPPTRD
jgi:hypothetical protein